MDRGSRSFVEGVAVMALMKGSTAVPWSAWKGLIGINDSGGFEWWQ